MTQLPICTARPVNDTIACVLIQSILSHINLIHLSAYNTMITQDSNFVLKSENTESGLDMGLLYALTFSC